MSLLIYLGPEHEKDKYSDSRLLSLIECSATSVIPLEHSLMVCGLRRLMVLTARNSGSWRLEMIPPARGGLGVVQDMQGNIRCLTKLIRYTIG